ncbi:hypothetical protein BT96DRAFT_1018868 [Gymnopus androsaceus JB14]|uniref:Uncharacterized protein n=1 Tax=Gymnopus androsaceus JB14 TaxID=1447944 RepID=A0A6A4HUW4_9AGAR|nr:hypothetical protein BT96DRAFT_1018868 [Gymnopus androsaceus JB14]
MAIPQTFDAFVPSNFGQLIAKGNFKPTYVSLEELKKTFDTAEFRKSYELAKKLDSESIFNHSLRMYYYSLAILHSGFPSKHPLRPPNCATNEAVTTHPSHDMTFEFTGGIITFEHLASDTYGPLLDASEIGDVTQSIMLHTIGGYDAFGKPEFLECMLHPDTVKEIRDAIPKEQVAKEFLSDFEEMVKVKPNCILAHYPDTLKGIFKVLRDQVEAGSQ